MPPVKVLSAGESHRQAVCAGGAPRGVAAAAQRPVLAGRFEVSVRTVERDLAALQQSGVPVYAEPGRAGGHVLDKTHTLPQLALTPAEATALAAGSARWRAAR